MDPAAVPEIADALEHLIHHDPHLVAAVADVDRTLIWDAMEMGALDYLEAGARMISSLDGLAEAA